MGENMAEKLTVSKNKKLKLTNVLIKSIQENEFETIDHQVQQMENFIKAKGSQPLGPLIQYNNVLINEEGAVDLEMKFLRQSTNFIHNVEVPYEMESVVSVKNCLYIRFKGEESKLKFAYDKLNLVAYEEDISLKGGSYTIFVDQQDEEMIVDIFMERED